MDLKLARTDCMKPSISCQVLDKALLGMNDTVIGNFEIDLGYYSLFSKISIKERLKVLLNNLKRRNLRSDTHEPLQKIINELEDDVNSQLNKIDGEDVKKKVNSIQTEAYILNKINTVADTFSNIITPHKEVHLEDQDQLIID